MHRANVFAATILPLIVLCGSGFLFVAIDRNDARAAARADCNEPNGNITLPSGFCATIFADKIGHAREIIVAPSSAVYVNTWSGRYYGNDTPPSGGMLVALQDTTGDGHADLMARFGPTFDQGNRGGTGIGLRRDWLYAETNDRIVRYKLPDDGIIPKGKPETVVSGLPLTGDHPMHPFAIDQDGNLFVDVASATNSCQAQNRTPNVRGDKPCTELETRAGIWRYDADRTDQKFSRAERYATGIRNADGIAIDPNGDGLYATQHGRDQLYENWPKLYTQKQGANLPAEELLHVQRGDDFGWPECYYDDVNGKLVLAPEYGGDGGKKVGICAEKKGPVAVFPAHWAPNGLVFYSGKNFPSSYDGGAFVAFHGSWNRAPSPQGGYNVVFQPLTDGRASGEYAVFADGFAGGNKDPGGAAHRPSGLAVGPNGALYISDDQHGRIWRITYEGNMTAAVEAAPQSKAETKERTAAAAAPPEGIHPDAGKAADLPTPPGQTAEQVALGASLFRSQTCAGCHGADAQGTPLAPDLSDGKWLWADGTVPSIAKVIKTGVPHPKNHASGMPPRGGAQLNQAQVLALADYVWALNHKKQD